MGQRDITKLSLRVAVYSIDPEQNQEAILEEVPVRVLNGKTELEPMVDADLAKFEEFYNKKLKDSLSKFEKAAIKTYLYWKTHPEIQ